MESKDSMDSDSDPITQSKKPPLPALMMLAGMVILTCFGSLCVFAVLVSVTSFTLTNDKIVRTLPLINPAPLSNWIVFVGNDDNIWLTKPDGQKSRQLTEDRGNYKLPTWSPDGRYIAFLSQDELYLSPATKADPKILYDAPDSQPFYIYWRPNSYGLTFLTRDTDGLSIRQLNLNDPNAHHILGQGGPFYWVWSPFSDQLLMHVQDDQTSQSQAHLSVLNEANDEDEILRVELKLNPGQFQAPVWSTDGEAFFYVASDENGQEAIYKTNSQTLAQNPITELTQNSTTYLVLSPQDNYIAYLETPLGQPVPIGTAHIVDTDGQDKRTITNRAVIAMYWSPDGNKLALLTVSRNSDDSTASTDTLTSISEAISPDPTLRGGGLAAPLHQENLSFRWWIYEPARDEMTPLVTVDPTFDFLQTIPFFDQYNLSLTFWSPDSRYFVVTSKNAESPEAPNQETGIVLVVDTTGQNTPRKVGDGTLAVWSWK